MSANLAMRTVAVVSALIGLLPGAASAQSAAGYPSKPIAIVLGDPPGASLEIYVRFFAERLRQSLKQPVLIDFRVGAGSTIGAAYVSRSRPDGHTLGAIASTFVTSTLNYKSLPYDPIESFAPITLASGVEYALVVDSSLQVNSLPEYLAYLKANPGKVSIGTAGAGSFNHLSMALLHQLTGTKVTFIHYKGGAPLMTDLLAGRIQGSMNSIQLISAPVASGKLKAIAISTAQRSPAMPQVRTVAEQGVAGYDVSQWIGFVAPAATPPAIINRLNEEFRTQLQSREGVAFHEKIRRHPVGNSPAEFKNVLKDEIARWKILLKDANLELGAD